MSVMKAAIIIVVHTAVACLIVIGNSCVLDC